MKNLKDNLNVLNIIDRVNEKTPPFWKKVRRVGVIAGLVGGAIISIGATGGIALPAWLASAGTILTTIGGTAVAVSSATSDER